MCPESGVWSLYYAGSPFGDNIGWTRIRCVPINQILTSILDIRSCSKSNLED
jgi:hypothetical protein